MDRRRSACEAAHPKRPAAEREAAAPSWAARADGVARGPVGEPAREAGARAGKTWPRGRWSIVCRIAPRCGGRRQPCRAATINALWPTGQNPDRLSGHCSGRRMFQNYVPPGKNELIAVRGTESRCFAPRAHIRTTETPARWTRPASRPTPRLRWTMLPMSQGTIDVSSRAQNIFWLRWWRCPVPNLSDLKTAL